MTSLLDRPVTPDAEDITAALKALPGVKDFLRDHPGHEAIRLAVEDEHGETFTIPRPAFELLARLLAHLAAGQGVSIVPAQAELTTQQAADMLNVSRPYLIGLLDRGEIEYRKVGTHRRILASSLIEYMREDDRKRRAAADELTALSEEMDLL
jgi:excisionase family DNA binding protein